MSANAERLDPTHDPRTVPTVRRRRLDPAVRAAVEEQRASLSQQLKAVDRALADLAKERRRLLDGLAETAQDLWSPAEWPRGRRPGTHTVDNPLPPLPERPDWLWGRRLRAVCLRLLQRCGTLPLRQLHALLHLHGFGVAGDQPVKVLADALGHEADVGDAVRVARGRYRAAPGYRPRPLRQLFLQGIELPDIDE